MKRIVTEKMREKIELMKQYFYSRTKGGHIINYLNGFVAAGLFRKPQKHLSKKAVNKVWLYSCGFNGNGSRIVEHTNLEMDVEEAKDMVKCLKIALNIEAEKKEIT